MEKLQGSGLGESGRRLVGVVTFLSKNGVGSMGKTADPLPSKRTTNAVLGYAGRKDLPFPETFIIKPKAPFKNGFQYHNPFLL